MINVILLALLLSQGGRLAEGISQSACTSILSNPLACIYSILFGSNLKPLPTSPDKINFYGWTKSPDGTIKEYNLQRGNDDQMQEIFGRTGRYSVSAYFHGIGDTGKADWILKIKDLFLASPVYGPIVLIVSVDYELYVQNQNQAALNVEVISQRAADFLNWTSGFVHRYDFYIKGTGHGMGGYIAGATLKKMNEIKTYDMQPWPLIVLDPDYLSSEALTLTANNPPKIDQSQAAIVIVYHTSTCSHTPLIEACNDRLEVRMGHYDFFPNGGILQTGCSDSNCSKNRAPQLLIEQYMSYPESQPLTAFLCVNFKSFQNGLCTSCFDQGCPTMSEQIWSPHPNGKYYLYTNAKAPFGRGHDQSRP